MDCTDHDDIPERALHWHRTGTKAVLATVIETWGSAPRQAGSQLAISGEGEMLGSVSGGCVEGDPEALRRPDQRFELSRLGTQLAEQPDTADGLGRLVGQEGKESEVLLTESIQTIGVAVHHADDIAHEFHGDGEFRADTLTDLDVTRILRDIGNTLRLGVQGNPASDALPLPDK